MGYCDLHAHVLPGLDDGARDLDEAVALVDGLVALGFDTICATPHQREGRWLPDAATIARTADGLRAALGARPVELRVAAENYWDGVFLDRVRADGLPCYPSGRAFLVEVPTEVQPPRLEDHLFRIRVKGLLPVLAHPERYAGICGDRARIEAVGRTAALVVDLAALDGAHGRAERRRARTLVEEGLAHAVTSDVHRAGDLEAVARGLDWLRRRMGGDVVRRLCDEQPRAVAAGELPS